MREFCRREIAQRAGRASRSHSDLLGDDTSVAVRHCNGRDDIANLGEHRAKQIPPVEAALQLADDNARMHLVDAQLLDHRVMRSEREGATHSAREIEVRSIEKHAGVSDAVRSEPRLSDGGGADRR